MVYLIKLKKTLLSQNSVVLLSFCYILLEQCLCVTWELSSLFDIPYESFCSRQTEIS